LGVNVGLLGNHPLDELLRGHFKGEESDIALQCQTNMFGNADQKARLTHAWATCHNDEVRTLQTVEGFVDCFQPGFKPGHPAWNAGVEQKAFEVLIRGIRNRHQVALVAFLADSEDCLFSVRDDVINACVFAISELGDVVGSTQQASAHGESADIAGVRFGVLRGGDAIGERDQVIQPANIIKVPAGFKGFLNSEDVKIVVGFKKFCEGFPDPTVAKNVKTISVYQWRSIHIGIRRDKNGTDESFFHIAVKKLIRIGAGLCTV